MYVRQSLVDRFSTFLRLEDDIAKGWMMDAKLHRSIQRSINHHPEAGESEPFWSMFWHQSWQRAQTAIALGHLSAYLQEVCYWSARTVKSHAGTVQYTLADFFQVAIAEVPKILNACDPNGQASLKTYANSAFGNLIRDFLRQRRDIDLCNEWGLLLKLSRKRLIEVLTAEGLSAKTIEQYVLAWHCFESLYIPSKAPGVRRTAAPSAEQWNAIANQYHSISGETCTPDTIERWLLYCTSRVRANLYPSIASLNAPRVGQDEGELQDNLEDSTRESLLAEMIAQEDIQLRREQYQQMNTVLSEASAALDETMQQLLHLYYHEQLTQQQIAKQLGIQQYAVSRKLAKLRETLLLKLARWSQETWQTSIDSTTLKAISPILDEWLQNIDRRS
ncbi:sigma-70 family RNA polymerase sigma factor [Pseudanabaenaceae cyanobacterium LEGE 13415]|nr:sigma-70 family RNA polymerase sigma factor [Pseudanabaenaceae cyanobacterium LEGE 13415]